MAPSPAGGGDSLVAPLLSPRRHPPGRLYQPAIDPERPETVTAKPGHSIPP